MKIESKIKEILEAGTFDGNKYFLPDIKLDRKDYVKCNEVLNTIGMIWTKWQKAHIGEGENLEETFRAILENGEVETLKEYRDRFQFFPTPDSLADYLVELAELKNWDTILEPSAWKWNILRAINRLRWKTDNLQKIKVTALELNSDFEKDLWKWYLCDDVIIWDFLEHNEKYDNVIANPPFSNSQDVKHILHAYSLLKDWGTLVSIASSSIKTRTGKLYDELRELPIEWFEVEEWAFKESNTMVNTVILRIKK